MIIPRWARDVGLAGAERIRRVIVEVEVSTDFGLIPVRLSLGVASSSDRESSSCSQLLRMADNALYRAKANGRNRVEQAPAESIPTRLVSAQAEALPPQLA